MHQILNTIHQKYACFLKYSVVFDSCGSFIDSFIHSLSIYEVPGTILATGVNQTEKTLCFPRGYILVLERVGDIY